MSKKIFFTLLVSISFTGFAQTKRETISETKVGTMSCEYARSINTESGDTSTYVYLGFQNMEYTHITDIKSIFLTADAARNQVPDFVKDLRAAYEQMTQKVSMSWDRTNYRLVLYDFSKNLYFYSESKGVAGYTTLTAKQVPQLITWFESIGF